jgi:hypothetical protein
LRKILTISLFLFGLTFASFAQIKPLADGQAKLVKYYPSPAATSIVFEFQRGFDKSYSLQLYNFMGKQVYEIRTTNQRIVLSLSELYRGIYIYQLRDKSGKIIESGKFQVLK